MAANWNVSNKEFTISDLQISIKYRPPKSMRDELDDHSEDYCSLSYEYWCDLLSTIKVKDERKRAAVQINNIAFARAASISDSNKSVRIMRKKKAKTGVLRSKKYPKKAHSMHHGIQRYCVIFNKAGMPDRKYT